MIGEDKVIRLGGCKCGEACSIVLRGASSHVLDEAERSLHDALCILTATVKEPRIVCGGGCTEILMAQAIDRQVESTPGKKALAMASFARALLSHIHHCRQRWQEAGAEHVQRMPWRELFSRGWTQLDDQLPAP